MINTTISKWGNSLALRIPQTVANQLQVKENSNVSLTIDGARLIIKKEETLEELLALITDENRHELMDQSKPVGKELI